MDERTGEVFPIVLERLHSGIHRAVIDTAAAFNHKLGGNRLNRLSMLPANLDPLVVQVDNALYKLARGIETLNYVNPINLQQEKRRFFFRDGVTSRFFNIGNCGSTPTIFAKNSINCLFRKSLSLVYATCTGPWWIVMPLKLSC